MGAPEGEMGEGQPSSFIRDVWHDNIDSEFAMIRETIVTHPYVAMDTEFPGVVARPIGSFKSSSDFHYQTLRCNVDLLKIIQIGLTLCNAEGELAPGVCTYQINFKFSLSEDMYSQDSINLLSSSGLDFAAHEERGVDPLYFAELLMASGIVLVDDVKWITFHSGYDFGYLLKVLTCQPLPEDEDTFFQQLKLYFPQIYDIKFLMKSCESLKGGLNKLAEDLEVERIGAEHNAGSDSLLTQAAFFKMRQLFFENELDDAKYLNSIHGLGKGQEHHMTSQGMTSQGMTSQGPPASEVR